MAFPLHLATATESDSQEWTFERSHPSGRFMKLRLDRVLKLELAGLKRAEVFKSNGPVPKFTQPTPKYSSPYPSYAYGWWEAFFPENMDK